LSEELRGKSIEVGQGEFGLREDTKKREKKRKYWGERGPRWGLESLSDVKKAQRKMQRKLGERLSVHGEKKEVPKRG